MSGLGSLGLTFGGVRVEFTDFGYWNALCGVQLRHVLKAPLRLTTLSFLMGRHVQPDEQGQPSEVIPPSKPFAKLGLLAAKPKTLYSEP